MSDDLVKRLRADAEIYSSDEMSGICARMKKAADRIAALEAEVARLREALEGA